MQPLPWASEDPSVSFCDSFHRSLLVSMAPSVVLHSLFYRSPSPFSRSPQVSVASSMGLCSPFHRSPRSLLQISVAPSTDLHGSSQPFHRSLQVWQHYDWLILPTTANEIIGIKEPNVHKILIFPNHFM